MERSRLIVLSGASSTGKTTAARELQILTETPAIFLPGDDLDLPRSARALRGLWASPQGESMQLAMDRAYISALAAFVHEGIHAIGEVILKDPSRTAVFLNALANTPRLLVRLTCQADERRRRESLRDDRWAGLSDLTAEAELVAGVPFDLCVDTTGLTPNEVAKSILAQLRPNNS